MRNTVKGLLLGLLLTLPAMAVGAPVIVVLGDSLSAGYGIDPAEGWVALMGERLSAAGRPEQVVNASISGDTTRGARARLGDILTRQAPELVVVELGGNDGLRGIALPEMRANLEAIVRDSRAAGARVLLLGVRLPPNYGPAYTRAFEAVYREVAEALKVQLVPHLLEGVAGDPALMQEDGIHPKAMAQERLVENVWPLLEPLLSPARAQR